MTLPLPFRGTSAPPKATLSAQTHEKQLVSWHTRGKKHSTLSLLLASMSQWIFYKLSPEVHKHWAREQERLSERQRQKSRAGSQGSLSGSSLDDFLASCMHGHLLGLNLQGGGSTCFIAAVNKAASLSVFQRLELTPASICPTLWLP